MFYYSGAFIIKSFALCFGKGKLKSYNFKKNIFIFYDLNFSFYSASVFAIKDTLFARNCEFRLWLKNFHLVDAANCSRFINVSSSREFKFKIDPFWHLVSLLTQISLIIFRWLFMYLRTIASQDHRIPVLRIPWK